MLIKLNTLQNENENIISKLYEKRGFLANQIAGELFIGKKIIAVPNGEDLRVEGSMAQLREVEKKLDELYDRF